MKYQLINPSDPYTLESDDLEAAALACVLLGQGRYALEPIGEGDGVPEVPFFIFSGHDEWFMSKFGRTVEQSLEHVPNSKLAQVLNTVTLTSKERSSMNDIGGRAKDFAAALLKQGDAQ